MDSGLASASLQRPGMTRSAKVDTLAPRVLTQAGLERIPVDLIHSVVMRGLDPRIPHLRKTYAKRMDLRVKPG
jgi:hypothetical protein